MPRLRVIHTFLWYLIYGHPQRHISTQSNSTSQTPDTTNNSDSANGSVDSQTADSTLPNLDATPAIDEEEGQTNESKPSQSESDTKGERASCEGCSYTSVPLFSETFCQFFYLRMKVLTLLYFNDLVEELFLWLLFKLFCKLVPVCDSVCWWRHMEEIHAPRPCTQGIWQRLGDGWWPAALSASLCLHSDNTDQLYGEKEQKRKLLYF